MTHKPISDKPSIRRKLMARIYPGNSYNTCHRAQSLVKYFSIKRSLGTSPSTARGPRIVVHQKSHNEKRPPSRNFHIVSDDSVTSPRPYAFDVSDTSVNTSVERTTRTARTAPRCSVVMSSTKPPSIFSGHSCPTSTTRHSNDESYMRIRVAKAIPQLATAVRDRMSCELHPRDRPTSTPAMIETSMTTLTKIVAIMTRKLHFNVDELVAWEILLSRVANNDSVRKSNGFTSIVLACALLATKHISDDHLETNQFAYLTGVSHAQLVHTERVVFSALLSTTQPDGRCNLVLTTEDILMRLKQILELDLFEQSPKNPPENPPEQPPELVQMDTDLTDVIMDSSETHELHQVLSTTLDGSKHARVMPKALSADSFFPLHDNRIRTSDVSRWLAHT